jgi:hypothetical protein
MNYLGLRTAALVAGNVLIHALRSNGTTWIAIL